VSTRTTRAVTDWRYDSDLLGRSRSRRNAGLLP
jgi:hypothetical protein